MEHLPPRPERFSIEFSRPWDYSFELSIFRCLRGKDFLYAMIPFEDNGRNFYAVLALGLEASDEMHDELVSVLNSLRIR